MSYTNKFNSIKGELTMSLLAIGFLISTIGVVLIPKYLKNTVTNTSSAQSENCPYEAINEIRGENNQVLPLTEKTFSWESTFHGANGEVLTSPTGGKGNYPAKGGNIPLPTNNTVHYKPDSLPLNTRNIYSNITHVLPLGFDFQSNTADSLFCEKIDPSQSEPTNCEGIWSPVFGEKTDPIDSTKKYKTATFRHLLLSCGAKVRYGVKVKVVTISPTPSPTPTPDWSAFCQIGPNISPIMNFNLAISQGIFPNLRMITAQIFPASANTIVPISTPINLEFNKNGTDKSTLISKSIDLRNILTKTTGPTGQYFDQLALVFPKNLFPNINNNPSTPPISLKSISANFNFSNCVLSPLPPPLTVPPLIQTETPTTYTCFFKLPASCQFDLNANLSFFPSNCNESCKTTDVNTFGIARSCMGIPTPTPCPLGQTCTTLLPISAWRNPKCSTDAECLCDFDEITPSVTPKPASPTTIPPTITPTSTSIPTQKITLTPSPPSPTKKPTLTMAPTNSPKPSPTPTIVPTKIPTNTPTTSPTKVPTIPPTQIPTKTLTPTPTKTPSSSPTITLTPTPTAKLSRQPTIPFTIPIPIASPSGNLIRPTIAIPVNPPPQNFFTIKNETNEVVSQISIELCTTLTNCQKINLNTDLKNVSQKNLGNIFSLRDNQTYLMKCSLKKGNETVSCKAESFISTSSEPKKIAVIVTNTKPEINFIALKPILDLNKNSKIETNDFGLFIRDYGKIGDNLETDFNGDSKINALDISILIQFLGDSVSQITVTPKILITNMISTTGVPTLTITPPVTKPTSTESKKQ